jgi:hypothetical protein
MRGFYLKSVLPQTQRDQIAGHVFVVHDQQPFQAASVIGLRPESGDDFLGG